MPALAAKPKPKKSEISFLDTLVLNIFLGASILFKRVGAFVSFISFSFHSFIPTTSTFNTNLHHEQYQQ